MVAAILPQEGQAWFFKIMGRESAVDGVVDEFREFVEQIEFQDGEPVIGKLPENWKRGGERAMRFASIDINTPEQQLDLSISQLSRMDDWDALVTSNIVRWRKQVGLDATDQKWSGAEELEWKNADSSDPAVWLDVTGRPDDAASSSMSGAPFAGGGPFQGSAPFAGGDSMPASSSGSPDPHAGLPRSAREAIAARTKAVASGESTDDSGESAESDRDAESKIQYDRPEGWRDGRMSMMRLAAFNVGPEDSAAEVTIINAGGDLRGNVARWMGQIRSSAVPDEDVDAAIENAEQLEVSGHSAQRFVLMPDDAGDADATAIDATIIPLEEGFSMFVKMTGPVETVKTQSEQMKAFLESIEF
ncbi:signal peptide protein [Rhodopirellula sallentina SM41]|uniref:Signal peptide protein n=2 Tax=Rhodopirellula TaxID=265488 RepID=M5TWX0_9BACT|nr:signal peptide protein [Rhodopirellula sallentina SM41]